jgi:hypothetical protein
MDGRGGVWGHVRARLCGACHSPAWWCVGVRVQRQVEEKGYAKPCLGKGKPVVAIGVNFGTEEKEVAEWEARTL